MGDSHRIRTSRWWAVGSAGVLVGMCALSGLLAPARAAAIVHRRRTAVPRLVTQVASEAHFGRPEPADSASPHAADATLMGSPADALRSAERLADLAPADADPPPADHSPTPAAADPHRLPQGTRHLGVPRFAPDPTPAAAAAGTEPGSMGPLAGIPEGWTTSVHRLRVGPLLRSYLVVRPPAPAAMPLPVVMVLHGRFLTPAIIERLTHMPATTGPAIEVYPAGYGRSWNAGGCCGQASADGIPDVTFLLDVVHQVLTTQPGADADRVYLVGYSNGGRMALHMACTAPRVWAGVAAVEAVPVEGCATPLDFPLILVASSHDPLLTITDGSPPKHIDGHTEPSVQSTVAHFRDLEGCSGRPAGQPISGVTVQTSTDCRRGARVAYALYPGGSHAWPQGTPGIHGTPSAQSLLWSWFTDAPLHPTAA